MPLAALLLAGGARADDARQADDVLRGWTVMRAMDCARCHGRDFDGWSAPSLIASVAGSSRERFERMVLEGDIVRGMPGYRSQPTVVDNLDAIYAYLMARARGEVGTGKPEAGAKR
jgi:mono/diheme cytochrome c family protein